MEASVDRSDTEKQVTGTTTTPTGTPNDNGRPSSPSGTRQYSGFRWAVICASLYITCFLYGLDTTIAADIQGPVVATFGQVDQLAWIGAGFPMGSVSIILLLGRLLSSFDIKTIFLGAVILFEAGSALCGAAPSMPALIVGRVVAGMGGSGIYLGCLTYFSVLTTEAERGFYMSLIGAAWGLGCVIGPLIGGAFAVSAATWRWAFYINLVIGGASLPAFLFALPSIVPLPGVSVRTRLAAIDWLGVLLGAGVWVTFLMAFTMAGGAWSWTHDGRTIAIFVVFGVVLLFYILQQRFSLLTTPSQRIFPCHLLRNRTQVLLYIATSASNTTLFVVTYYTPLYFQFVAGDSALFAAVRLLPFIAVAIFINLASNSLLHLLIPHYRLLYLLAGATILAGGAPLMVCALRPTASAAMLYGLEALVAIGAGLTMITAYSVSSLTLPADDVPFGLSLQNVSQIGGSVIALALAGQIYQSTAGRNLARVVAAAGLEYSQAEITAGAAGAQSALFEALKATPAVREQAVEAVAAAMRSAFVLVPVAGAVMLLAAVGMRRERIVGAEKVVAVGA